MITSLANPLVKQVRALRQRKARAKGALFLVEGIHNVGEAVEAGWKVETVLYAQDVLASEFAGTLLARSPVEVQAVSAEVMRSLSEKDNPQGILAVVHQKHEKLGDLPALRSGIALVAPQDPGNVGTVLRTADAVGADAVILLDGGADPYHPTSVRASMGTLFWTPVVQAPFVDFQVWASERSVQLIGTSAHAQRNFRDFEPVEPWMLLLGSEQKGLLAEHMQACSVMLSLPMQGRASSLNLAVAAGILLYEFAR